MRGLPCTLDTWELVAHLEALAAQARRLNEEMDNVVTCDNCQRDYRTRARTEGGGRVPQKECPYCGHATTRLRLPRAREAKKEHIDQAPGQGRRAA